MMWLPIDVKVVLHVAADDVGVTGTTGWPVQPAIGTLSKSNVIVPFGTESEVIVAVSATPSFDITGASELAITIAVADTTMAACANAGTSPATTATNTVHRPMRRMLPPAYRTEAASSPLAFV